MRWKSLLGTAAVLLLGVAAYERSGSVERTEVGVPRELAGRWVSASPRFAERFLSITPSELVFGQGADGEERHPIESVWLERPRGPWAVYVVRYLAAGDAQIEVEMRVLLRDGYLRLDSLPDILWTLQP